MSFDCLLFGAGHKGTPITIDGDFVERIMGPVAETTKKVPFEVKKYMVEGFTYVVAEHPPVSLTPEIVDAAITASGVQPLD
ncbi:hypothetical protein MC57_018425 [Enterobacter hormaechei]|uniref:hypothetical protein n=1 Tax=Enterobacter hormaechei TaxID=158836 RepID=UPI0005390C90|nr:hypothetical protein [Enterobacter hormaechei]PNP17369.1 hypothetical protein MC57_018425 [Enterobacter hormaechei]